jgi:hypothetical protein
VSMELFASSFQCRGEAGKSLFLNNVPVFVKNFIMFWWHFFGISIFQ